MRRRGWGGRRGGRNGGGRGNGGGHGDGAGRGEGGRSDGGGSPRLLEKLRELRGGTLHEVRAIESVGHVPDGVALGAARGEGNRPVAIVASRREGLDLLGWARIAARRAGDRPLHEVFVAAPFFSTRTRAAAERAAERGPILHLLTLPSLAESETFAIESFPPRPAPSLLGGSASLLARVLRVIQGGAAVTSAGAVHPAGAEHQVFVRGERVARVFSEGDGIVVAMSSPDHRKVHVTEGNFPRWGVELYEWIVGLAQDPRLLEGEAARGEIEIERAAEDAHAGVTARWLPWSREGDETLDWVGVDIDGRPVLGVIRESLALADVPGLVASWHLLDLERVTWTPGATGAPRLFITAPRIDALARDILEELAGPIGASSGEPRESVARDSDAERAEWRRDEDRDRDREPASADASADASEGGETGETGESGEAGERSGRRRRRRRRGRGGNRDFEGSNRLAEGDEGEPREEPSDLVAEERSAEPEFPRDEAFAESDSSDREPAFESEPVDESGDEPGGEPSEERGDDTNSEGPSGRRRGRRGRRRRGRRGSERGDRPQLASAEAAGDANGEGAIEAADEPGFEAEPRAEAHDGPESAPEPAEEDLVTHEIEATLVEGEEERERSPAAEPVEPPPRARRQRAAILVRNEAESILAALVLARDRRTIVSFRVAPQEALMDFFKGPATDIADNVDVLVVGFTAQPRPNEVLATAELFRGRLQWFDHHDWAIEDVERLRAALGRDSILIAENAASPLAAVTQVTERRSRFTDKLVDLSARRLSEVDMQKWGYRVMSVITRMAATPGEHRAEIISILAGKPTDLPSAVDVYGGETRWVEENDPRIVHFGEYQLAVCQVPENLDPGEVGRRVRQRTGARLSLASRAGDDLVMLSCNDEKRPLNVMSLLDAVGNDVVTVHPKTGGDRVGRARVDGLAERPERIEDVIGGIVRHRSILYG